ncbi:MAG: hypothetical protein WA741_14385 [Candidatus Sulfotelmatobacter sp.]
MKTLWVTTLFGLAVMVSLGGPHAYAQFEIAPDHFDEREPEPIHPLNANTPSQSTKIQYAGNVTLPYTLQCTDRILPPGKYSVSLDSDGRTARVTLNRKDAAATLQGFAHRQNRYHGGEALVVERNGGRYRLSAIHLAQLDLVFNAHPEHQSDGSPRNFERVALILAKAPE